MECQAALDANYLGAQDTPPLREGCLDVLAQHILGTACGGPFLADVLTLKSPVQHLTLP